jgi:hypothetical protein
MYKKRRGVVRGDPSVRNDAAGLRLQTLEGVKATERDAGSVDAQVADHRESHEGIAAAAAASHPMNSGPEQTSRNDGSTNTNSQKIQKSKSQSNASVRQWVSAWDDRLCELADYRKIYRHCNVPTGMRYKESAKLGTWVASQRSHYRLYVKGKRSPMTYLTNPGIGKPGF